MGDSSHTWKEMFCVWAWTWVLVCFTLNDVLLQFSNAFCGQQERVIYFLTSTWFPDDVVGNLAAFFLALAILKCCTSVELPRCQWVLHSPCHVSLMVRSRHFASTLHFFRAKSYTDTCCQTKSVLHIEAHMMILEKLSHSWPP